MNGWIDKEIFPIPTFRYTTGDKNRNQGLCFAGIINSPTLSTIFLLLLFKRKEIMCVVYISFVSCAQKMMSNFKNWSCNHCVKVCCLNLSHLLIYRSVFDALKSSEFWRTTSLSTYMLHLVTDIVTEPKSCILIISFKF